MADSQLTMLKNMKKVAKDMEKVEAASQKLKQHAPEIKELIRQEVEGTDQSKNATK